MIVVGVLLLIVDARDSYADGGLASAMVGLGAASCGPLLGALADRIGQRPVLLVTAVLNAFMLVSIVLLSYQNVPLWALLLNAVAIGATAPQLSPMSRARLVNIINHHFEGDRKAKVFNSVMSYESVADEMVFVFGPVLVGALALGLGTWSPLSLAAIVTVIIIGAFALHPTSKRIEPHTRTGDIGHISQAPVANLFQFNVLVLVFAMVATGMVFGSTLTSLTTFMGDIGDESAAGIMYGALGIGSAILALSVGFFSQRFALNWRLITFATVALIGGLLYPFAYGILSMALILVLIGFGIGPVLVTIYSLGSIRGPHGRSNTIMTMLSSGIVVGQASSAAVTGAIAENYGTFSALFTVSIAALLLFLLAAINLAHQRRTA